MVNDESGRIPSGVGYVDGGPPPQPTRWFGKRRELSSPGGPRNGITSGNTFLRILKATERSFLYLFADALSSSNRVLYYTWGQDRGLVAIAPFSNVHRTVPITVVQVYVNNT